MLQVIFKLLATNGADYVIGSWLGLLDTSWMLLLLGLLFAHVGHVVLIFLVQELCVLFGKLAFFLELEDRSAVRRLDIKSGQIIFANVYLWAQSSFHLLLLLRCVLLEVVAFMCVSLVVRRGSATRHVRGKRSWLEARHTVHSHPSLH
jgi:hypothetical protein